MTPVLPLVALAALAAPPTFPVSVESVYVDVFVRDARGPVLGLRAADFELCDNGVLQSPELVATEKLPLTTLMVLDTSDSVRGDRLEQLQAAGRALLRQYRPGDEVGLLTFGHEVRLAVPPIGDLEHVEHALLGIQPGGSTALLDALYAATQLATGTRALVFLFTDGEDNMSVLRVRDLVRALERSDVMLQAVGVVPAGSVGKVADEPATRDEPGHVRVLRRLAGLTGGRFWSASASDSLANAFLAIAEAMRTRYVLRFDPTGVAAAGRHELRVGIRGRSATVYHRKAYYVARPAVNGPRH